MRVIGTAGHVDHGKSTLVEALTGIHPDRLKEEREREMTIDLGFAWLNLPGGEEVGIVDVPGHRDFIENMLAGVGGIDAALFVVAADEGVMPQTREHLAILDLLEISSGVVALTKVDLVDDPEWLDLVESDLRLAFQGTVLEKAAIVQVSAPQRRGLEELLEAIKACLAGKPTRPDYGRPRLPVDRAFSVAGFGSVVTGTLSDGQLKVGDEVDLLPRGLRGRVRGLQTHKHKNDTAVPGSRTAVNVSGLPLEDIARGDVLVHPGDYVPTRRLDVRFRLLPGASASLRHNTDVKFFLGAAEIQARLRLLGKEELQPGESGWLQLELSQPTVAVRGDRYILRRPSPGETLGGGAVLDAHPTGRHKRFASEVMQRMEALSHGTPAEVLMQALTVSGPAPLKQVLGRLSLDAASAEEASQELLQTQQIVQLGDDLVMARPAWERLAAEAVSTVHEYHRSQPLMPGMPRQELKSRIKSLPALLPRLFNLLLERLVEAGQLEENGPWVLQPGHAIRFSPAQQAKIDGLLKKFAINPYSPPSVKECQAEVGEDVYNALLALGLLVSVSSEVVFRQEDYAQMVRDIKRLLQEQGTLSAAQVRDHFNTSRKYALALLEHLDASGVTVRDGDVRQLK
jgi:selenocysteine-specific elongation factor